MVLFCSVLFCSVKSSQAKWGCSATSDCNRLCTCTLQPPQCRCFQYCFARHLIADITKNSYHRNTSFSSGYLLSLLTALDLPTKKAGCRYDKIRHALKRFIGYWLGEFQNLGQSPGQPCPIPMFFFLLNEYFIELNTANFKILNKSLN